MASLIAELDLALIRLGVALPEYCDVADEAQKLAVRGLRELGSELTPRFLEIAKAKLHELVLGKKFRKAGYEGWAGPGSAHGHETVAGLGDAGEAAALLRA
jgi:hypothetical protein